MVPIEGQRTFLTLDGRVWTLHARRHVVVRINSQNAPVPFGLVDGGLVDKPLLLMTQLVSRERIQGVSKKGKDAAHLGAQRWQHC